MTTEDPIQNLDTVDIVARRRDGAVDLLIVASGPLNASERHQGLLLTKIESYLRHINSPAFAAEFGPPSPRRVRILVDCAHEPHPEIRQLLQNAVPWIEDNHAGIALRVGE